MNPSLHFVELCKQAHSRKTFDCGSDELNTFLYQFAAKHKEVGVSKTMVLPADSTDKPAPICAFYTLSHTEIKRTTLPPSIAKKLPHYPVPVLLIAQLAVHKDLQGRGLGEVSLIQALRHCLNINSFLPSYAVIVDSLENNVIEFYTQFGFKKLSNHNNRTRLYIPMKTLSLLFG